MLARGNLSLSEKDDLLREAENVILGHPGIATTFAFAGEGGLNSTTGGSQAQKDLIGQIQFETIPWEDRALRADLDGDTVIAELTKQLSAFPGIQSEVLPLNLGPASGKPMHLRFMGIGSTSWSPRPRRHVRILNRYRVWF